ncbi:MAG TPA: Gfo/Idh/MocA family oxidoreductase [Acidimicrobiales bacterium]|nr:Gfo/Idh/MocA family oxidoreductase [Acidimicrobiales bacterium]
MTASGSGAPAGGRRARIGVVGAGWWATEFHIPALLEHPAAELVAVAEPDKSRREAAAAHFGLRRAYDSLDALLDGEDVDGVIIASPSASHFELARRALTAGLHVLVEKPMTIRSVEAWELNGLADERSLHLSVGYTYQHTRAAKRLTDVVAAGELGEVINIASVFSSSVEAYLRGMPDAYRSQRDFRVTTPLPATYSTVSEGGGQAYAQSTHVAGMICHVTGLAPTSVFACLNRQDLEVDVAVSAVIRFDNGASGTLASTGTIPFGQPKQQTICYYATAGYAVQDLIAGSVDIHYANGRSEKIAAPGPDGAYPQRAPAQHLCDLITGATATNPADGRSAARAVEIVEAIHLSAQRASPVAVPPHTQPNGNPLAATPKESRQ